MKLSAALTPLAALPLLAAAASAQQAQTPAQTATQSSTTERYQEVKDGKLVITEINMSVDQVDGMEVIGPDGAQIGEIEDVLADDSGKVIGFAVETEGFLGLGSEDVIVRFEDLQFLGGKAVTKLTEEDLGKLPLWDD